jgi:hypothetical protein
MFIWIWLARNERSIPSLVQAKKHVAVRRAWERLIKQVCGIGDAAQQSPEVPKPSVCSSGDEYSLFFKRTWNIQHVVGVRPPPVVGVCVPADVALRAARACREKYEVAWNLLSSSSGFNFNGELVHDCDTTRRPRQRRGYSFVIKRTQVINGELGESLVASPTQLKV